MRIHYFGCCLLIAVQINTMKINDFTLLGIDIFKANKDIVQEEIDYIESHIEEKSKQEIYYTSCIDKVTEVANIVTSKNKSGNYYYKMYQSMGSIHNYFGFYENCFHLQKSNLNTTFIFYELYNRKSGTLEKVPYGKCILFECYQVYKEITVNYNLQNTDRSLDKYQYIREIATIPEPEEINKFTLSFYWMCYLYMAILIVMNIVLCIFPSTMSENPYEANYNTKGAYMTAVTEETVVTESETEDNNSSISDEDKEIKSTQNISMLSETISGFNMFNMTNEFIGNPRDGSEEQLPIKQKSSWRKETSKRLSNDSGNSTKSSTEKEQNQICFFLSIRQSVSSIFYYYLNIYNLFYVLRKSRSNMNLNAKREYKMIDGLIAFFFLFSVFLHSYQVARIGTPYCDNGVKCTNFLYESGSSVGALLSIGIYYKELWACYLGIILSRYSFEQEKRHTNKILRVLKRNSHFPIIYILLFIVIVIAVPERIKTLPYQPFLYLYNKLLSGISILEIFWFDDSNHMICYIYFALFHCYSIIFTFIVVKLMMRIKYRFLLISLLLIISSGIRAYLVYLHSDLDPPDNSYDFLMDISPITFGNMNKISNWFIYNLPNYCIGFITGTLLWMDEQENLIDNNFEEYYYGFSKLRKMLENWIISKILFFISIGMLVFSFFSHSTLNNAYLVDLDNGTQRVNLTGNDHLWISFIASSTGILQSIFISILILCCLLTIDPFANKDILVDSVLIRLVRTIFKSDLLNMISKCIYILNFIHLPTIFVIITSTLNTALLPNTYITIFLYGLPSIAVVLIIGFSATIIIFIPLSLIVNKNFK